jgi:hypothetical protein
MTNPDGLGQIILTPDQILIDSPGFDVRRILNDLPRLKLAASLNDLPARDNSLFEIPGHGLRPINRTGQGL